MIYIEPIHMKWNPGKSYNIKYISMFERYIADTFVEIVQDRIDTQKFSSKWKPLSSSWLEFKKRNGLSEKTWEATGSLKNNLKVKKNNVIGFDNRKRYRESHKTYLQVARELEYGTDKIPPRPLFRLVYSYMRKNIRFFIEKYYEEGGE